jgi:hypothetical protein
VVEHSLHFRASAGNEIEPPPGFAAKVLEEALRRISQAIVLEPVGIATVSRLREMVGGVS